MAGIISSKITIVPLDIRVTAINMEIVAVFREATIKLVPIEHNIDMMRLVEISPMPSNFGASSHQPLSSQGKKYFILPPLNSE